MKKILLSTILALFTLEPVSRTLLAQTDFENSTSVLQMELTEDELVQWWDKIMADEVPWHALVRMGYHYDLRELSGNIKTEEDQLLLEWNIKLREAVIRQKLPTVSQNRRNFKAIEEIEKCLLTLGSLPDYDLLPLVKECLQSELEEFRCAVLINYIVTKKAETLPFIREYMEKMKFSEEKRLFICFEFISVINRLTREGKGISDDLEKINAFLTEEANLSEQNRFKIYERFAWIITSLISEGKTNNWEQMNAFLIKEASLSEQNRLQIYESFTYFVENFKSNGIPFDVKIINDLFNKKMVAGQSIEEVMKQNTEEIKGEFPLEQPEKSSIKKLFWGFSVVIFFIIIGGLIVWNKMDKKIKVTFAIFITLTLIASIWMISRIRINKYPVKNSDDAALSNIETHSFFKCTSGGIIHDDWLVERGLDTTKVWDDVMTASGVTYKELYLLGLEVEEGVDYGAWLARGLEPGVDTWPEEADKIWDLTKISVCVTGPASNAAVVVLGPVRHVGNEPKVYTIRSGRSYSPRIRSLHGKTGLAGCLEMKPVEGVFTFTKDNRYEFILGE